MTGAGQPDAEVNASVRAQADPRWRELLAGSRSRAEVAGWAQVQTEDDVAEDELDIQGLLFLQTVNFVQATRPGGGPAVSDEVPDAQFWITDSDASRALEAWRAECARFDADPEGWMRRHLQGMVREFAKRHGEGPARSFADKLVASGDLAAEDVPQALAPRD
jgi:hypothetical protein